MSRKIISRFYIGPVSISLLATLTGVSLDVYAQGTNSDPATLEQTAPQAASPSAPAEAKEGSAPDSKKPTERITVTGSRIKQIELEGPKPIVKIEAVEIQKSGATNVNEYLEKLTLASFGSASYGSSNGAPAGTQGFNLRGLGSANTLVLLNGRRLVRDPSLEIVDLSVIPTAAVETIEILKGTASAIYGTDAAAGVVNIITRKDYQGVAFGYGKTKQRYAGGGDHDQAYALTGTSSEKSSNLLTFQWDQDEGTKIGNRPWVDRNYRSVFGYPFSYLGADDAFHPTTDCKSKLSGADTFCEYNYMDEWQLGAPVQKISFIDDFSYNLGKNTKLGVRFFVTKKSSRSKGLRETVDESGDGYQVSQAAVLAKHPELENAAVAPQYLPNSDRGDALGVYVHGRLVGGPASSTQSDQLTYSGTTSITHEFDGGQALEVNFSESRIERTHHWLNQFDNQRLSDAIWDGSYDVFAATPQADLSNYRLDLADRHQSIARTVEATYSGEMELASRNLGYAVGISQIRESYILQASPNKLTQSIKNLGGGGAEGERHANAIFGELKVPIVSTLEASVAARYDDYTDFGDTFNPALGLQYRIGKEWFFRGNYGTGFKAPSLRDVHDAPATYFTSAIDYKKCNEATAAGAAQSEIDKYCRFPQNGTIVQGGNENLKPEKSQSINLFVGYEPVPGYGVNLEYFNTVIKDQIGSVSANELAEMEAAGKTLPGGTGIVRDLVSGDIVSFISPASNISTSKTSGLETSGYAAQDFGFGRLSFKTNYSYYLSYKSQNIPQGPYVQQLETSETPRWRWNNTFGYGLGINDIELTSHSNGRYQKGNVRFGYVGAYTSWDLNYGVTVSKNMSLNVGGENIFNQPYPLDFSDNVFRNVGAFYTQPTVYVKADFTI